MPQGPVPPIVRFTPDELKYILANGKMTPELMHAMHPEDLKVAQKLFNDGDYHVDSGGFDQSQGDQALHNMKEHPGAALGLGAAASVPMIASVGPAAVASGLAGAGKVAGTIGAITLASKLGVPAAAIDGLMLYMGMKAGAKSVGGAMAGEAASAGEAAMGAEEAALRTKLAKEGYKPDLIDKIVSQMKAGAPARTASPTIPPSNGTGGLINGPSFGTNDAVEMAGAELKNPIFKAPPGPVPPGAAQAVEKSVFGPQGGEAATFGVRPPPYSSNVSTQESLDDLIDRITGQSRVGGSQYPLKFHGPDGPALRSSVEKAKRVGNAKRRSPVPDNQD